IFAVLDSVDMTGAVESNILRHRVEAGRHTWLNDSCADVVGGDDTGGSEIPAVNASAACAGAVVAVRHPDLQVAGRTGNERPIEINQGGGGIIVRPQYRDPRIV